MPLNHSPDACLETEKGGGSEVCIGLGCDQGPEQGRPAEVSVLKAFYVIDAKRRLLHLRQPRLPDLSFPDLHELLVSTPQLAFVRTEDPEPGVE